jgi:hypothetical protein
VSLAAGLIGLRIGDRPVRREGACLAAPGLPPARSGPGSLRSHRPAADGLPAAMMSREPSTLECIDDELLQLAIDTIEDRVGKYTLSDSEGLPLQTGPSFPGTMKKYHLGRLGHGADDRFKLTIGLT